MKTLLILRHAKSSWSHPGLSDHDRPLNQRGFRDAPRMGRLLARRGLTPDLILTSTAERARTTAEHVAETSRFTGDFEEVATLYGAAPQTYLEVVRSTAGAHDHVMVVGHNPGIQRLISWFAGHEERVPTATLAHVELDIDDWDELDVDAGRLVKLWRPKELGPDEDEDDS